MSSRPMTSGGALKAVIEAGGLRVGAYRDKLPKGERLPAVSIDEDVATTPERHGDPLDGHHGESELLNVHLWQALKDQNKRPAERFDLARALTTVLRTCPPFIYGPDDSPTRVYGLRIDGRARIIEGTAPNEIVHHVLTVTMRRDA